MTSPDAVRPASLSALVVTPAVDEQLATMAALRAVGFQVTALTNYPDARTWLMVNAPALLVTALKLAEYNGLHLVLRGRASYPTLPAIVTLDREDVVLRVEAERLKATFAVRPLTEEELIACACRTLRRDFSDLSPIRPPFERRHAERRRPSLMPFAGDQRRHERRRPLLDTAHQVQLPAH